jgi:hypothetical protein
MFCSKSPKTKMGKEVKVMLYKVRLTPSYNVSDE